MLCYKWYNDTDTYQALIIVPDKLRSAVLTQLHNVPTAAHLGVKKTYEKVKQRFYWLNMRKYEEQWCQCCEVYYIQCIIDSVLYSECVMLLSIIAVIDGSCWRRFIFFNFAETSP